ncbi:hypothetical protein ACEYYB_09650 [Paracoccus sp. p4-l81]|uniref:hypothetical protein n=1 Tax=Paracoccus sp. p4-l81 TaxID=3342806 RepID=UPI0035B98C95
MTGVRSPDLDLSSRLADVIGNSPDGRTVRMPLGALAAVIGAQIGPAYRTYAELAADTQSGLGAVGSVWADPTAALNGVWRKGADGWLRLSDLPPGNIGEGVIADLEARYAALASGIRIRGNWSAATGQFPTGAQRGDSWYCDTGGTVGGQAFQPGDRLLALVDGALTDTFTGNWAREGTSSLLAAFEASRPHDRAALAASTQSWPIGTVLVTRLGGLAFEVVQDGHHFATAGGAKIRYVTSAGNIDPDAFGAAGDGLTDDTLPLRAAAALATAIGGGTIRLRPGAVYRLTEELSLADGTTLEGNGAHLDFYAAGARRNLPIDGDGVRVSNVTVRNMKGDAGFEGTLQTPIMICRYSSLAGAKGIIVENATVVTQTPGGNGIGIIGDTSNVIVRNIVFPDSDRLGIPILVHWSFNGNWQASPPKQTAHQRNLIIENIDCGNLTYSTGTPGAMGVSVIFLSACYNVIVRNVTIKSMPNGKAVSIYAGDWGYQYAAADERPFGNSSIVIESVRGRVQTGLEIYMANTLDPPLVAWPAAVSIRQMHLLGYGAVTQMSHGFRLNSPGRLSIEDSTFDGFYIGGAPQDNVNDLVVRRTVFRNSRTYGFAWVAGSGGKACCIDACLFEGNNQAGVANMADILIDRAVSTLVVRDNTCQSPNMAWSIRLGSQVAGAVVERNDVIGGSNSSFSFGTTADYGVIAAFRDNRSQTSPPGGVRTGQIHAAHAQGSAGNGAQPRQMYGASAPATGQWAVGDVVFSTAPASGGSIGWVCVAGGTPGTWKAFGTVA